MNKLFSLLSIIFAIGIFSANAQCTCSSSSCKPSTVKVTTDNSQNEVIAYYFHSTRRCATCKSVEAVAKEAIKSLYGEKVPFKAINIDENKDHPLIKKHKINWQTWQ